MDIDLEFSKIAPVYSKLLISTKSALTTLISDEGVSIFSLEGRVKDKESFKSKLNRKHYDNPFDDVEDICGLRIICFYNSDLELIESLIRKEFNVISADNKIDEMTDDRFGYLSRHYIVKIKDEWLVSPDYRQLGGLKFEIQLRTILMHTWAAISHKLLYKKEGDVPKEIKRKLNRLSALIELADEQFELIRESKVNYSNNIFNEDMLILSEEPLNSDNLKVLMEKYFPGRKGGEYIPEILEEIRPFNDSVKIFEEKIKMFLPFAEQMERETCDALEGAAYPMWHIQGIIRSIMDTTCEPYWKQREEEGLPEEVVKIKRKFSKYIKRI